MAHLQRANEGPALLRDVTKLLLARDQVKQLSLLITHWRDVGRFDLLQGHLRAQAPWLRRHWLLALSPFANYGIVASWHASSQMVAAEILALQTLNCLAVESRTR